jgi:hypothetical protein
VLEIDQLAADDQVKQLPRGAIRHGSFPKWSRRCPASTGGADLTFAARLPRVPFANVKSQSSTRINGIASGPLILTFAKVPAQKGYEC